MAKLRSLIFVILMCSVHELFWLSRQTQHSNQEFSLRISHDHDSILESYYAKPVRRSLLLLAEAKGVAGLGKAGGDGQGGSDKAGQQVPPEVYIALTYAGSAFLFSLSVPLLCYGGNMLFNKLLACFGRGPSSERDMLKYGHQDKIHQQSGCVRIDMKAETIEKVDALNKNIKHQQVFGQLHQQNQHLHQQIMQQQYSKYHRSPPFALSADAIDTLRNGVCHRDPLSPIANTITQNSLAKISPKILESNFRLPITEADVARGINASSQQQSNVQLGQHQDSLPFMISSSCKQ